MSVHMEPTGGTDGEEGGGDRYRWTLTRPVAEVARTYRLDPTRPQAGYASTCEDGANGLSSILALDAMRFLVVERACLLGAPKTPAYNTVRVYEASFAAATDVSGMASLAGQTPMPATKRLVVDLASWIPRFPASLARLPMMSQSAASASSLSNCF